MIGALRSTNKSDFGKWLKLYLISLKIEPGIFCDLTGIKPSDLSNLTKFGRKISEKKIKWLRQLSFSYKTYMGERKFQIKGKDEADMMHSIEKTNDCIYLFDLDEKEKEELLSFSQKIRMGKKGEFKNEKNRKRNRRISQTV